MDIDWDFVIIPAFLLVVVVLVVLAVLSLLGIGKIPVYDNSHIVSPIPYCYDLCRIVDEEAGVVCWHRRDGLSCLPISVTLLGEK